VSAVVVVVAIQVGRRKHAEAPPAGPPRRIHEPLPEPAPAAAWFRPWSRRRTAFAVIVLAVVGGGAAIAFTRPDGAACRSNPAMIPDTAGIYVSGMPRQLSIEDLPAPGRPSRVRVVANGYQWAKIADWSLD
jgi:hypothetical protein